MIDAAVEEPLYEHEALQVGSIAVAAEQLHVSVICRHVGNPQGAAPSNRKFRHGNLLQCHEAELR
jgi:hypothetical protein